MAIWHIRYFWWFFCIFYCIWSLTLLCCKFVTAENDALYGVELVALYSVWLRKHLDQMTNSVWKRFFLQVRQLQLWVWKNYKEIGVLIRTMENQHASKLIYDTISAIGWRIGAKHYYLFWFFLPSHFNEYLVFNGYMKACI